jgi:UDP-N-acetylglucosamine--N-acetylmuramyl-(pentapeptide) pyrophosphoryl-undecaprenol N-acetylglucosamine transferase
MKICMTGGHLTPALATIKELQNRGQHEIFFIGRKTTTEGDKTPSIESQIVPQLGLKFFPIHPGRLQRRFSTRTIPSLIRTPIGFLESLSILVRENPNVVVSFGGYVALPVVLAAWMLRIPIVTHEQTSVVGLANRIIAHFAARIAVSFESSIKYFPPKKVVLTGNPIRTDIMEIKNRRLLIESRHPVILITGGNQGSHVINTAVAGILPKLLEKYVIIHQVGMAGVYNDHETMEEIKSKLPAKLARNYHLERYISPDEFGAVLKSTDLAIARSGANAVMDFAVSKVPCIFIPLPFATHDEQTKNARLLVDLGAAVILPQRELTPERLLGVTEMMIQNLRRYKKAATTAKKLVRLDAGKRLADEVLACAKP